MNRRSKEGYEEENERGEKMNTSGPVNRIEERERIVELTFDQFSMVELLVGEEQGLR